MTTKSSVVEIKNLVMNHESRPINSNSIVVYITLDNLVKDSLIAFASFFKIFKKILKAKSQQKSIFWEKPLFPINRR